jgi:membrane protein DedA with SNARE-associated domain
MTFDSLLGTYGYWAVLVGTFLEGETILVLGGVLARMGYLHLPGVILCAFIGSLCSDQLFFYLGRSRSRKILAKRPSWKLRIDKVQNLLVRFRTPLILLFRFLYGLRTVTPFVIGMSPVSTPKFVLLNAVGALLWATAVGTGGYYFGSALVAVIKNIKHYEVEVLAAIAGAGALIWIIYFFKKALAGKKGSGHSINSAILLCLRFMSRISRS